MPPTVIGGLGPLSPVSFRRAGETEPYAKAQPANRTADTAVPLRLGEKVDQGPDKAEDAACDCEPGERRASEIEGEIRTRSASRHCRSGSQTAARVSSARVKRAAPGTARHSWHT